MSGSNVSIKYLTALTSNARMSSSTRSLLVFVNLSIMNTMQSYARSLQIDVFCAVFQSVILLNHRLLHIDESDIVDIRRYSGANNSIQKSPKRIQFD